MEEVCIVPTVVFFMAAVFVKSAEFLALARVGRRRRASGGSRECERMAASLALSCAP